MNTLKLAQLFVFIPILFGSNSIYAQENIIQNTQILEESNNIETQEKNTDSNKVIVLAEAQIANSNQIEKEHTFTASRVESIETKDTPIASNIVITNNEDHSDFALNEDDTEAEKISDPLEPFNRSMYSMNKALDKAILNPVTKAYVAVVPNIVQSGISNFLNYLKTPINAVNFALQGNKQSFGDSVGRFMVNTLTLGFADIATDLNIPKSNTSFGDTLGVWGVKSGPYIVLPLLGPSTIRDTTAKITFDIPQKLPHNQTEDVNTTLTVLDTIDTRKTFNNSIKLLEEIAIDEYSFVRDGFLQQRTNKIEDLKNPIPNN